MSQYDETTKHMQDTTPAILDIAGYHLLFSDGVSEITHVVM